MIVNVDGNAYDVGRDLFRKMLRVGKKSVRPNGVYAIEKDGVAIMLNKKAPNLKTLKRQVDAYKEKGFKVYYNGRI